MKEEGFSLIELMIVITIFGVLALIAVVGYTSYIIKARVTEGLSLASTAQFAVAEFVSNNNNLPSSQLGTGYISPSPTQYVSSIVISDQGLITIGYTPTAGSGSILLVPTVQANQEVTWDCKGGTLSILYRPASCR